MIDRCVLRNRDTQHLAAFTSTARTVNEKRLRAGFTEEIDEANVSDYQKVGSAV